MALYQHNDSLRELVAKVVTVEPVSTLRESDRALFRQISNDEYVVTTVETIFYAQGGVQPSDSALMRSDSKDKDSTFEVSLVRNAAGGRILQLGRFTPQDSPHIFSAGESVHQSIDGVRRELNSRVHTAGHVVGLAVHHLASDIPGVTELKAMHYPDSAFVEFKGHIDGKHKAAIQSKAEDFVQQAFPVKVYWWAEEKIRDECAAVPENVPMPADELIRVVDIVGAGAYPCGGTHVANTSQIGKLEIRKISRQKGISKVSYSIK